MNNFVPNYEQQAYEVPGRQLGWRVAQLQAQGLPYDVQRGGGGVYIVIVQQPVGAQPFAQQSPARPRPPRNWTRTIIGLGVVAIILFVGWTALGYWSGAYGTPEPAAPAADDKAWLFSWPWDAPAATATPEPAAPQFGLPAIPILSMPANPIGDAYDGVVSMVTTAATIVLVIIVFAGLWMLSGPLSQIIGGISRRRRG